MPVHACASHHCTAFRVPRPCLQALPAGLAVCCLPAGSNNILLALLNAQARLRCGDLANVDISQVRPPLPGALACQQHLSTCRCRPQSRDSHRGQHPRLCPHNVPPSRSRMQNACTQCMHIPQPTSLQSKLPIRTRLRHGTA